jgi:hypothetical protein
MGQDNQDRSGGLDGLTVGDKFVFKADKGCGCIFEMLPTREFQCVQLCGHKHNWELGSIWSTYGYNFVEIQPLVMANALKRIEP